MIDTGRAWAFVHPDLEGQSDDRRGLALTPTGRVRLIERDALVRQAVLLLLSTRPGERVMRPDYGCDLDLVAFAPNDATTAGLAAHAVRQALERFEPRVEVLAVDVRNEAEGRIEIVVEYRILESGRRERLIHPHDLEPGGR